MKDKIRVFILMLIICLMPVPVYAMHIGEGFLPPFWCAVYFFMSLPFFILGLFKIRKISKTNKDIKLILGLASAYCLLLSALKLPSVAGSSSHPTGTGLGAILFGPTTMSVISTVVLIFQALFLAHGGITTLGANLFSMGIVGPIVGWLVYRFTGRWNKKLAVFLSAMLADLSTYVVTSLQMALAFPAKQGGVIFSFIKFASIFAITQIPLAIVEGLLTVAIFKFIQNNSFKELRILESGD